MFENFKRRLYIGNSVAASWAWGASILAGISILTTKGILPFWIWAIFNSATLIVFGLLALKLPKLFDIAGNKGFVTFMTIVRIFSIWVQMSAIYEVSQMSGIFNPFYGKTLAFVTGAVFMISMYKDGLNRSMKTDQYQWYLTFGGAALMIVLGMINGDFRILEAGTDINAIKWGIYAGILMLGGPIVDLQNWQRARLAFGEKNHQAYYYAAASFFLYMTSIFIMVHFEFSPIMNVVLLFITFMVATSTMDSDAVALHEIAGQKVGLIIGLLTIITWQFVNQYGFMKLWLFIGGVRIYVAIGMVVLAIVMTYLARRKNR